MKDKMLKKIAIYTVCLLLFFEAGLRLCYTIAYPNYWAQISESGEWVPYRNSPNVCIGDSTTYGYTADNSYPHLIGYFNAGIPYNNTSQMFYRLKKMKGVKRVIWWGGWNDFHNIRKYQKLRDISYIYRTVTGL